MARERFGRGTGDVRADPALLYELIDTATEEIVDRAAVYRTAYRQARALVAGLIYQSVTIVGPDVAQTIMRADIYGADK